MSCSAIGALVLPSRRMNSSCNIIMRRFITLKSQSSSLRTLLNQFQPHKEMNRTESRVITTMTYKPFYLYMRVCLPTKKFNRCICVSSCSHEETIFSLSSGHGKCGVAVIRISGPQSTEVLRRIGEFSQAPPPRKAILRRLVDPSTGEMIDKGIILHFPKPGSFTGEDCAEFQVHGGPAVVSALLTALSRVPGCRQAEPGDFTKRAFLNGKLDLTEVEGLGDLIHAETEAQRRQALRQMDGELGMLYRKWTEVVTKCLADIEAFIDFSEDQDIEEYVVSQVNKRIYNLAGEIETHLDDNRRGERLRQGVQVVIMGEPNVGKSSLLNAVCQRSAAIVTSVAGTTRDVIETAVNIGGFPVVLSDTAGLRQPEDEVENEGIIRAIERYRNAELRILVIDSSQVYEVLHDNHTLQKYIQSYTDLIATLNMTDNITDKCTVKNDTPSVKISVTSTLNHLKDDQCNEIIHDTHAERMDNHEDLDVGNNLEKTIIVLNKVDKLDPEQLKSLTEMLYNVENHDLNVCMMSCLTKFGFIEFLEILKRRVEDLCGDPLVGHPSLTQNRHRDHLLRCLQNLYRYNQQIEDGDVVLAAQCLRRALRHIGSITGRITSEDVLDVIFRDFCIGK